MGREAREEMFQVDNNDERAGNRIQMGMLEWNHGAGLLYIGWMLDERLIKSETPWHPDSVCSLQIGHRTDLQYSTSIYVCGIYGTVVALLELTCT